MLSDTFVRVWCVDYTTAKTVLELETLTRDLGELERSMTRKGVDLEQGLEAAGNISLPPTFLGMNNDTSHRGGMGARPASSLIRAAPTSQWGTIKKDILGQVQRLREQRERDQLSSAEQKQQSAIQMGLLKSRSELEFAAGIEKASFQKKVHDLHLDWVDHASPNDRDQQLIQIEQLADAYQQHRIRDGRKKSTMD